MQVNRRMVLGTGVACAATSLFGHSVHADFAPEPGAWRRFEITTKLTIARPKGATVRAWVPMPAITEPDWIKAEGTRWTSNADQAQDRRDAVSGAVFVNAEWEPGTGPAEIEVVSVVATQDRAPWI